MNEQIKTHMKKLKKITPSDEHEGLFTDDIVGPGNTGDKSLDLPDKPEFRVKTTHLLAKGLIHLQMGVPDPTVLHEAIEDELGTAFVATGSERVLRTYGVAFNIHTSHQSIDEHEMKELGHRLSNDFSPVMSFASPVEDYLVMEYISTTEGKDNRGKEVQMLEFHFKSPEKKETLYVAYSQCKASVKTDNENYPVMTPEWFLAWLCSYYYDTPAWDSDGSEE